MTRWIVLATAVCCTALAIFVPWASYGDIDVKLHRFPAWYVYVAAALVMHGCVPLRSVAGRVVGAIACVVAAVTTVVLFTLHDNASALFDGPVPAVAPRPGLGALFALAGVLLNAALLARRRRA